MIDYLPGALFGDDAVTGITMLNLTTPPGEALALYGDEGGCLGDEAIRWLLAQGVSALDLRAVRVTRALFSLDGRYTANVLGDFALVLGIVDGGDLLDLAAWCPASGEIGTRLGLGYALGQEQFGRAGVGTTGPALQIWRTPLEWLQAGKNGLCVIDFEEAARRLAGLTLVADDEDHARDLRELLRVPSPLVLVANRSSREAA